MQGAPDYLKFQNPHEKDDHITFDEGPHIYTVDGKQGYTSITTLIGQLFEHFDAEKIATGITKSRKMLDPAYKYYGMSKDDMIAMWKHSGSTAAAAGTKLHYDIECYYNNMDVTNTSVEYGYFQNFLRDYPHLKPYRTEWCVFYEQYKLSGSIDMIYENPDGTLRIYDWKRVQEITYDSPFGKSAIIPCLKYIPDTNFWHYAIQLNMYKTILEHEYGKKVTELCLVCLHPNNTEYEVIPIPDLSTDVAVLLNYRKETLAAAASP